MLLKFKSFNFKRAFNSLAFRRIFTFSLCLLAFLTAQAASGAAELMNVAKQIGEYQETVQNILYAVASVIVLVGAFNIFHKMTNGDQDVKKTIMLTIGGCIAFVALAGALPKFFS